MDAKQFLAEFGHIANAPGGVTRLRELIFSLASDGKLIPDCELIEKTHLDKVADFVMGQAPLQMNAIKRAKGQYLSRPVSSVSSIQLFVNGQQSH